MKVQFRNSENKKIIGIMNIVDKKSPQITIIIHGYSSNKDGGSKITADLLKKNKINNITIDLDNMGESEPEFEDMTITRYAETIYSAVKYCRDKGFTKINIIGTSTGGLSAMAFAIKHPIINTLILRSASASDAEWFKNYVGGDEGLAEWKNKGYIIYLSPKGPKKIKYSYYKDALRYDMCKKAKEIKIPTLMIHGTKDSIVPIETALKLKKNFPKAKLVTIKGADHSLGIEGDYSQSQKLIVDWIKRHN
jgi:hypothetical protein